MQSERIYIGKIAGLKESDIREVLVKCGNLVDFLMKENYGFAEFETENEATQAIMELDGRSINGIRIFAEFAKKKSDLDQSYFKSHPRIYVGRLPHNVTKEILLAEFGKFGKVQDILKKNDYSFIEYETADAASQAIKTMNGYVVGGNRIIVEGARPKETQEKVQFPRLYIGKLGPLVKKADLVDAFGTFGEIIDIIMKDDYAFLEYSSISSASRAITELNGSRIQGSKIIVEEAKPKDGEIQLKKLPIQNKHVLENIRTTGQKSGGVLTAKDMNMKVRGRRLSPRRSLSRSRSRSQDSKSHF